MIKKWPVLSTQQLVESCKQLDQPDHKAFCIGYFSATYDTYLVTRHPDISRPFICPKQPAPKRDDLIGEFVQWSGAHKMYDSEPAADNVLRFLAGRYPCPKS